MDKKVLTNLEHILKRLSDIEKGMATKDDLKGFATKDDLKGFATKDDLNILATKKDLKSLELRLTKRIDNVYEDLFETTDKNKADKVAVHALERRVDRIEQQLAS